MAIVNQPVTVFRNLAGSIEATDTSTGTVYDRLPDEVPGSGLSGTLAVGDTIKFNNYRSQQTTISDQDNNFTESEPAGARASFDTEVFGQPAGTTFNSAWGWTLQDSAGVTYDLSAYSYGVNNDDGTGGYDIVDGFLFFGPNGVPPEGETLTITALRGIDNQAWASAVLLCFAEGSLIETMQGEKLVEELSAGDLVKTLDHGYKPLRYILTRKVPCFGSMRPVVFEKGAIGNTERLRVSQRHRMHTTALREHLLLNIHPDSLIWAVELCNGSTIHLDVESQFVTYYHLMFDQHELIYSSGVISESWQPSSRNLKRDPELTRELLTIFPEIRSHTNRNNGAIARQEVTLNPERMA